jgi:hypothetical protein
MKILEQFGFEKANHANTPIQNDIKLLPADKKASDWEECEMDKVPYLEAVGALLYLANGTRPDISFATSLVGCFANNPEISHWNAVKRIFRYLIDTKDRCLHFYKPSSLEELCTITLYADADWAGDLGDRKSMSGIAIYVGPNLIHWSSKKQTCTSTSTMEAEYVACASGLQEAIFQRNLLAWILDIPKEEFKIVLRNDNESALQLIENANKLSRAKHTDLKYHFIRDLYYKGEVEKEYCNTHDMIADILTKGLPTNKHNHFVKCLNLVH